MLRGVLRAQAVYYAITGAWPLLSMRTFEMVTGPKTDDWLVRMVGLLTVAIAVALWGASRRPERPRGEVVALAALSAASFAGIDIYYSLAGRILPVYLGDAAVELALIAALAVGSYRRGGDDSPASPPTIQR